MVAMRRERGEQGWDKEKGRKGGRNGLGRGENRWMNG